MAEERLQKVLARGGIASRRQAEKLIELGRVRVDGEVVTTLGTKVDARRQKVEVDGHKVHPQRLCYGIFHKPRGMVTTASDPEGRPTTAQALSELPVRVIPVGRLDFNTSGALIFTNDGDFAQALLHPKTGAPKVYVAKVQQELDEGQLERWAQSIEIEGRRTRPAAVRILRRDAGKTWVEVTLKEGKNRQVRRLGEHAGSPVVRLSRLSHAGISTEGLRPGHWRLLSIDELKALKKAYGVPEKIRGVLETRGSSSSGKQARGTSARSSGRSEGNRDATSRAPTRGGPRHGARSEGNREATSRGASRAPTRGPRQGARPEGAGKPRTEGVRAHGTEGARKPTRAVGSGKSAPAVVRNRGSGSSHRPKKR